MPTLLIFGDSITWGAWDNSGGGWAQRLRSEIDKYQTTNWEFWCPTYILGISGNTTKDLDYRIENEISTRVNLAEETIVLIAIGINDSALYANKKSLSAVEYYNYFKSVITKVLKYTNKVAVLGLFPINESLLNPVSWDKSISYTFNRAIEFNSQCIMLAKEYDIPALDFWTQFKELDFNSLLFDGLHPNSSGHILIYEAVRSLLYNSQLLVTPFVKQQS